MQIQEKKESEITGSIETNESENVDPVLAQELSDEVDGGTQEYEDHKADYNEKSEDELISKATKILKNLLIQCLLHLQKKMWIYIHFHR